MLTTHHTHILVYLLQYFRPGLRAFRAVPCAVRCAVQRAVQFGPFGAPFGARAWRRQNSRKLENTRDNRCEKPEKTREHSRTLETSEARQPEQTRENSRQPRHDNPRQLEKTRESARVSVGPGTANTPVFTTRAPLGAQNSIRSN